VKFDQVTPCPYDENKLAPHTGLQFQMVMKESKKKLDPNYFIKIFKQFTSVV
jgi:hypothetical protein